jgi:S1-C subfamily serine protease
LLNKIWQSKSVFTLFLLIFFHTTFESIFGSFITLILILITTYFFFRKFGKQIFSTLRHLLHRANIPYAILGIFIILIAASSFALYKQHKQINLLEDRLGLVETKLGGPDKISCNEKDSIEKVTQSVVRIVGGEAEGSGFAIQSDGLILTNFHVIEFEPSPKVVYSDNTFETGEIVMADKNADLAIIKVERKLPAIAWGVPSELAPADEL